MEKLFVIKIGGNVLDNESSLKSFLKDFASIQSPKILIHGGGKIATKIGEQLGIASNYINGRRITDAATLDLVTMVYGGLVNKQVVAALQSYNCNAMGLTGVDGSLIHGVKRPVKDIDYGFVGDIAPEGVNTKLLQTLLSNHVVPVFAPLTHQNEIILNTNADTITSTLAIALSALYDVRVIYCFEKPGILRDVNDDSSVINLLTHSYFKQLLNEGALHDGILPKLENAFASIRAGVKEVLIGEHTNLIANTTAQVKGTLITL